MLRVKNKFNAERCIEALSTNSWIKASERLDRIIKLNEKFEVFAEEIEDLFTTAIVASLTTQEFKSHTFLLAINLLRRLSTQIVRPKTIGGEIDSVLRE